MPKTRKKLESEIRKMVKKVNDSLYRLEKADVTDYSREYQMIEHYAVKKNSKMYNVNLERGTIRATKDLKRFKSDEELYRYKEVLKNIIKSKTRTVKGTREAMKKSFETFKKSKTYKENPNMSFEDFRRVMKIWRTKVQPDEKAHLSSSDVVEIINITDLNSISDAGIEKALKYAEEEKSVDSMLDEFFDIKEDKFEHIGTKIHAKSKAKGKAK